MSDYELDMWVAFLCAAGTPVAGTAADAEPEKLTAPLDSTGNPCRSAEKAGPAAEPGKDTSNT